MDAKDAMKRLVKEFGSRLGMLGHQLIMLSMTGQPCDVTFYRKKPALNVIVDQKINIALMYGAGERNIQEQLENIRLSKGDIVSLGEIWTINPMPEDGLSDAELAGVDLSEGEQQVGPNGETLRKMISDTYHCESRDEEDYFLRRFIAS